MTKQLDTRIIDGAEIKTEITSGSTVKAEIQTEPIIKSDIKKNSEVVTKIETAPIVAVNLGSGGQRGYSAYEIWLQQGNVGTVSEYLESLRGAGAASYVHDQIMAETEWLITHWLNKYPSVTIVDSGENLVLGDVDYIDKDTVAVRFTAPFGGKAYLN